MSAKESKMFILLNFSNANFYYISDGYYIIYVILRWSTYVLRCFRCSINGIVYRLLRREQY